MSVEKRELIPQSFRGEVHIKLELPEEARRLMNDLHQDRQGIAAGGLVLLACIAAVCLKHVFARDKT